MAGPAKITLKVGGELTASFRKTLRTAQKQISTFQQNVKRSINDAATGATRGFKNVVRNDAFQAAAASATGLGLAITGAVRTAMEFESSMLKVKAISGATEEQFKALNDQAKLLGRTTQFSASEAADAMSFLSMAGYDTTQILDSTGHMLNLAAAAGMELGEAADIASNILGGMGLQVDDTNMVIDVLAKTASSGNTNIQMLGESFKSIAAIAPQAGVSIQDAGAAFAVLGNSGIQASEAGTALRNILLRLSAPPSEAAKAFDRLGVSTKDSAGNMRPYEQILKDMDAAMKRLNLGTAEQTELQAAIFGVRAAASGATLQQAAASGQLAEMTDKVTASQGAAATMAETMQSGLGGTLKRLQSAAEGLAIAFGGPLLGPIASVLEGLAAMLSPVAGLMEKFPVLAQLVGGLSIAFIGLVAALPILAALKGAVIGLTGATTVAAGAMAILTSPVTLTIAAIVGLIAIFTAAYNHVDWFKAGVDAIIGGLAAGFSALGAGIMAVWDATISALMPVFEGFKQMFMSTIQIFQGLWQVFTGIFTGDSETAVEGVKNIFGGLKGWFTGLINSLGAIWQGLTGFVGGVIQGIVDMFLGLPGKLVEVGGNIINTIKDGFLGSFGALKDAVVQGFQEIRNLLPFSDAKKGPFSDLTGSGRALVETISKGIRDRQQTMAAAMQATAEGAMATMDETLGKSPLAVDATVSSAAPAAPSLPSLVQPVTRAPVPITRPQSQGNALGPILGGILGIAGAAIPEARPFIQPAAQIIGGLTQDSAPLAATPAPAGGGAATLAPVVTVNVTQSNATPEDIALAVQTGLDDALGDAEAGMRALLND